MKHKVSIIFWLVLIITGLFFGGYVLSDPIQQKVGLHILNRIAPSDLWVKARSINLVGGGASQDNILAVGPILLDNATGLVGQLATPGFDGEVPLDGIQAVNNMVFNGTDYDRGRSVGIGDAGLLGIPAQGEYGFNGATWDRIRSFTDSDTIATGIGNSSNISKLYTFETVDGLWHRMVNANQDGNQTERTFLGTMGVFNLGNDRINRVWTGESLLDNITGDVSPTVISFVANGPAGTFDRQKGTSVTNLTDTISKGTTLVAPLSTWSETSAPATGVLATVTKVAGGAGVRHVSTHITVCLRARAAGGGLTAKAELLDGAAIKWSGLLGVPAAFDSQCLTFPLTIVGSDNTAMILAFTAAPAANNDETVTLTGYSVN